MFDTVERHHNLFKILLAMIALSFVTFGVHSFSQKGHDYIVKIGDEKVSEQQVNRLLRNVETVDNAARDRALTTLVEQAYFIEGAKKIGITPSLELIKKQITKNPYFQDENGFSEAKFNRALAEMQISQASFIESEKRDHYLRNVMQLLTVHLVSDAQIQQFLQVYEAQRTVDFAFFDPELYRAKIKPTADALENYYNEHQTTYHRAPAIQFEYVKLTLEDLAARQAISQDALATALNHQEADEATRKNVLAQLQRDKASREMVVIKEDMAEAAFNYPDSLNAVADLTKTPIQQQSQWQTAEDLTAQGLPVAVVEALFSEDVFEKGHASDTIDTDQGVWVVRVTHNRPASVIPFDEVKERVRQDYIAHEAYQHAVAARDQAQQDRDKIVWEKRQQLTPAEARMLLDRDEDFQAFMQVNLREQEPVVLQVSPAGKPALLRMSAIKAVEDNEASKQQARIVLMQLRMGESYDSYYRYLRRIIKQEQGLQRIDG